MVATTWSHDVGGQEWTTTVPLKAMQKVEHRSTLEPGKISQPDLENSITTTTQQLDELFEKETRTGTKFKYKLYIKVVTIQKHQAVNGSRAEDTNITYYAITATSCIASNTQLFGGGDQICQSQRQMITDWCGRFKALDDVYSRQDSQTNGTDATLNVQHSADSERYRTGLYLFHFKRALNLGAQFLFDDVLSREERHTTKADPARWWKLDIWKHSTSWTDNLPSSNFVRQPWNFGETCSARTGGVETTHHGDEPWEQPDDQPEEEVGQPWFVAPSPSEEVLFFHGPARDHEQGTETYLRPPPRCSVEPRGGWEPNDLRRWSPSQTEPSPLLATGGGW
jgi:hypothetical protein